MGVRAYECMYISNITMYKHIPHADDKMNIGPNSFSVSREQVSLSRLLTIIQYYGLHCVVDVIKIFKLINVGNVSRVQNIVNILQE